MGTIQAVEALKILLGIGETLANRLLVFDALAAEWRVFRWKRNPNCPVCGDHPTITALIDYDAFCGVPTPKEAARPEEMAQARPRELSPGEAAALLGEPGVVFVDVRPPEQYAAGHIPGSLSLPLEELSEGLADLPKAKRYVLVCNIGVRSAAAREYLESVGEEAWNLRGGVAAWINEGLPWEGR
jgi:rhodanese-related sulfurtransferase